MFLPLKNECIPPNVYSSNNRKAIRQEDGLITCAIAICGEVRRPRGTTDHLGFRVSKGLSSLGSTEKLTRFVGLATEHIAVWYGFEQQFRAMSRSVVCGENATPDSVHRLYPWRLKLHASIFNDRTITLNTQYLIQRFDHEELPMRSVRQ